MRSLVIVKAFRIQKYGCNRFLTKLDLLPFWIRQRGCLLEAFAWANSRTLATIMMFRIC